MSEGQGSHIIQPPSETPNTEKQSPKKSGKGLIALGILVLVLAGGFFWYWNQSIELALEISPTNSTLVLDGKPVTLTSEGSLEVKRGKHRLEVVHPGYITHDEALNIGFGSSPDLSITLQLQPGLLTVISDPDEATVTIGGKEFGTTPLNGQELAPGDYTVSIEKENYLPYSTPISIEGRRERARIETTLTPAWSRVSLTTTPEGATLYVNDDAVGTTPVSMDLLLGEYELRLEMEEREPQRFSIRVPANQTVELPTRSMEWKHGSVFIATTPPGAWVKTTDQVLGQTPGTFSIPSKNPIQLSVSLIDHEEETLTLTLQPDEAVERRLELKPFTGKLSLKTTPTKAEVFIDGSIRGLTPLTLELPVKSHSIELRKAGYIAQTHRLSPLANKTANYTFTLIGENKGAPLTDDQIVRALIAQKEDMIKEVSTPYGYKMTLIEPDTYSMGLPENYPDRQFNETQVRMRIRQPFYMGLHEVSNREYKLFKADHDSGIVKGVSLQSGDRPVVGVSWRDAVEYCNWLSEVQGLDPAYQEIDGIFSLIEPRTDGYRLPTEAEWEYVARYNSGTPNLIYPWGIEMPPLPKSGNFAGEEAKVMISQSIRGYRDGYRATAPVGSFSPNSLGIYDLGGNVAEWCTDYYTYTYPSEPRPLVDWAGPEKGDQRSIRGSGWRSFEAKDLRNTLKRFGKDGADDVGFRLVRSYPLIIEE